MARKKMPKPLLNFTLKAYSYLYGVNLQEAKKDLSEYETISQFFIRELKKGIRPIEKGVTSPVDGTLRSADLIVNDTLQQVKGKTYSLSTLLGGYDKEFNFIGGSLFNMYLSPRDYHRVHSPITGKIVASCYIPGKLWPVTNWSLNHMDGLFSTNERIITFIRGEYGYAALIMVGATNVGKMGVVYDDWKTNSLKYKSGAFFHQYNRQLEIKKGQEIGYFELGSSVIMLFEASWLLSFDFAGALPQKIKYGQMLATALESPPVSLR